MKRLHRLPSYSCCCGHVEPAKPAADNRRQRHRSHSEPARSQPDLPGRGAEYEPLPRGATVRTDGCPDPPRQQEIGPVRAWNTHKRSGQAGGPVAARPAAALPALVPARAAPPPLVSTGIPKGPPPDRKEPERADGEAPLSALTTPSLGEVPICAVDTALTVHRIALPQG